MKKTEFFNFIGYTIENIEFKINRYFDEGGTPEPTVGLSLEAGVEIGDKNSCVVVLECSIFDADEFKEKNYPYALKIRFLGSFEHNLEDNQELLEQLIKENAPAILYPYLRATVSHIVSLAGLSPMILPTMNFTQDETE